MIDALLRLFEYGTDCCSFYQTITGRVPYIDPSAYGQNLENYSPNTALEVTRIDSLNPSQSMAVTSCEGPLSLIWGPPGLRLLLNSRRTC
jgi:regulator of nonsense transcripts 1